MKISPRLKIIYAILNCVAVYGLILPSMISMDDDFVVVAGVLIGIVNAVHIYDLVVKIIVQFKNQTKNENNETI